jgi:hypothetical protein
MITYNTNETWQKQEDGTMKLIHVEHVEAEIKTPEELIAEKEEELFRKYAELLALRKQQETDGQ